MIIIAKVEGAKILNGYRAADLFALMTTLAENGESELMSSLQHFRHDPPMGVTDLGSGLVVIQT